MSDPLSLVPRRIVPWTGPFAWTAAEVPAREWMIPVGAEVTAELEADGATPLLDALAADLAARLDHGRGFAVLRGWGATGAAMAPTALARRIGTVLDDPSGSADAVFYGVGEAGAVTVRSAASLHNTLLRADRAALAALYEPAGAAGPVFSAEGGLYAGRWDEVARPEPALAAAAGDPAVAATLDLRAGDVLALNPFLIWATAPRGAGVAAARTVPSRLDAPAFAPRRPGTEP